MIIRVERKGLNLPLTLYPSFVLALLEERGGAYVKVAGRMRGCFFKVEGEYIVTNCGFTEVSYWTGVWFLDRLRPSAVKPSLRWLVETLCEAYSSLGLAINPFDPLHVFIPVFLSQNTSYHTNVLRWCRALWSLTDDPLEAGVRAREVSGSYQLARLYSAVKCCEESLSADVWETRIALLRCKWVGPKVADAFLLFGLGDTTAVPVDKHFTALTSRLGLWRDAKKPQKNLCAQHPCPTCPRREFCLRWRASNELGELAGWVQTVFYVHDKLYCSAGKCYECPLRSECQIEVTRQ